MYNVLYDSDDSSKGEDVHSNATKLSSSQNQIVKSRKEPSSESLISTHRSSTVVIPSFEDLSGARADEEMVLSVVYGEDFQRHIGVWGCARFEVNVRPPDIEPARIGCQLTLSVQLGKKYPYIAPVIVLRNVKGLSHPENIDLQKQLNDRANELSVTGSVMMIELVQVAEDYLLEHNSDPTMSAWEKMKAQEELIKAKERNAEEEIDRIMNSIHSQSEIPSPKQSSTHLKVTFREDQGDFTSLPVTLDIERELARQSEAFQTAISTRQQSGTMEKFKENSTGSTNQPGMDSIFDDEDYDYDPDLAISATSSRYETDFVELGVLGRGGGGEVVKVKNRLDRRIYAVKKIILESERGRNAQVAVMQNRKLLREVTTISRMTHINIVRYYQAWVEGGSDASDVAPIAEEEIEDNIDHHEVEKQVDEESDDDSVAGWWANSPQEEMPLSKITRLTSASVSADEGSSRMQDDVHTDNEESDIFSDGSSSDGTENFRASGYMNDVLEQDNAFQSPLLTGLGFQNQMYNNLYDTKKVMISNQISSEVDNEDIWGESSVKIDSKGGKSILYIQMEYCSSTLRELIDNSAMGKLGENEVWRLIRQILEALSYLHRRNVIHRDLVSIS